MTNRQKRIKKTRRYKRILKKHEAVEGDVKFGNDYLLDLLNTIIHAEL